MKCIQEIKKMPVVSVQSNKVLFSQAPFVKAARHDSFREKLLGVSNTRVGQPGYCLGFSTKFLHHYATNNTEKFLSNYHNFSGNPSLFSQKLGGISFPNKEDILRQQQTRQLLKEIVEVQDLHMKSNILDFSSCLAPEPDNTQSIYKTKSLHTICKGLVDAILLSKMKQFNTHNDELANHANNIKLNIDKFFAQITSNKTSSMGDENVNTHVKKIKETIDFSKETLSLKEVTYFLKPIFNYSSFHLNNSWENINKKLNINGGESIATNNGHKIESDLNKFLISIKNSNKTEQLYLFYSPNHACAIGVKENIHGDKIYTFFNPNREVYETSSFNDFSNHLNSVVNIKAYQFQRNKLNTDYLIKYTEFENNLSNEKSKKETTILKTDSGINNDGTDDTTYFTTRL